MDDTRIISIRNQVFKSLAVAKDKFQTADILYESKKYQASIPFFRDAILYGIKALLMLDHDDLPDDSRLVNFYYQSDTSKEIKLNIGLKEILTRLNNVQDESIDYPLGISKEAVRDMVTCHKHIENFLAKARRYIDTSLLTTQEIKRKKSTRKLIIAIASSILAIFIITRFAIFISTLDNGLTGRYYAGQDFERLIKERKDKRINFNWDMGNIINDYFDNVSIRWTGQLKTPRNGQYMFITRSDDGARLWIDDKIIIDDWHIHAEMDKRENIYLDKGYHNIRIEYFDSGGQAIMKLMWLVPGWPKQKIISPGYFKFANN